MKTILIATDFSQASRNASLYALKLAELVDAKIILFNAYHLSHPMAALTVQVSEYAVLKETEQKLNEEASVIIQNSVTPIESTCDHGPAEKAIVDIAKEKGADFIIMGMKGMGKSLKNIFGSTASLVAKNTGIPLIIVPEESRFSKPERIVFASDINLETDSHVLNHLRAIKQLFKSKIFVVKVIKNKEDEYLEHTRTHPELKADIKDPDICFEFPVDMDITHGLNLFIEEHHINMLIMMPHKHKWTERLFKKSETKDMIFHTHVPLLILPEKYLE